MNGPSVNIEVNQTAALLLAKLMSDLGTEEPTAVLSRALGLLDQALSARRQGRRLCVHDPESGRLIDVVV